MGLGDLITEARSTETCDLDLRTTRELVELMNRQDAAVPAAVGSQAGRIAAAVDAIVDRLEAGGRLVYVGAGTFGDPPRSAISASAASIGRPRRASVSTRFSSLLAGGRPSSATVL